MEFITNSPQDTKKLGQKIAADIVDGKYDNSDGSIVLALSGNLGSGKTTFIQGLAWGLGVKERVLSPTFIIMRQYGLGKGIGKNIKYDDFYHIDVYRLERNFNEEMDNLGLGHIISSKDNIVVVEWADKIKKLLPKKAVWIDFDYVDRDTRKIKIR